MAGVILTARYGQSKAKKSPLVTRMRTSVRQKTPVCRAIMTLPLQKNLFLPGKTSHFLRAGVFFFLWGDSIGEELCVLI